MRTVIVTTSYPTRPEDPAGHFVRAEALALAARGDDVHVIAPTGIGGTVAIDDGVRVWPIVHGGAFGWPGAASRLRARPWRAAGAAAFAALASDRLKRLAPQRIVAHWLVPCAHPIASSCAAPDLEAVAHGGDVRLLLALPESVRIHLVGRLLETATTLRFAARASHDALCAALPAQQREALAARAVVRPAGLTMPDVSADAADVKASVGSRPLAVTVSRLVASKRVDLAIEAVKRLESRVALGVVGEGPERSRLISMTGASDVRFEGLVPRARALAWIAAADVLVHPSQVEAAPTVVREARLLGTPVVACDAGDVRSWAQCDDGIVVVPPDPGPIATAIERFAFRSS